MKRGLQKKKFYVVVIADGTNPELSRPFESEDEQDAEARRCYRENEENVILWLIVNEAGEVEMEAYSHGFFEEEADDAAA